MHWWQGAFTSSSKSRSSDDSVINATGESSRHSLKSSFFSSRRNRLLSRSRKLRQATENDADVWRSPGLFSCTTGRSASDSTSSASPQPLPLPELQVLLQHDPKFASSSPCSVPLPSPDKFQIPKGFDEKEREREATEAINGDAVDGFSAHRRLVGQDARKNAEHSETRSFRKSPANKIANEKSSKTYTINIPSSCPASPYSSPALSPPRSDMWASQYMIPPGVFQVWSAPEIPHSDRNSGLGFYYQKRYQRTASSVDNSPLQSPRLSPPMAASPVITKMPSDIHARWESNAQATVHPLPLPPGAVSSSQSNPISTVGSKSEHAVKPEVKPIKSKWQKGKLIGRGTFGSVYVASNRETGALCAMKVVEILPDDSKYAENMRQLEQEIKVLSRLKHPNIVQYFGSELIGDKFYIYLEYVHPGSINKFIHDHCGAITESVVRNFTRHILCGLAYLHSKKTIHRDIKGANLLVDAYGVVKLADFGMAKHLNGQTGHLSLKGSPYWMAPELLQSAMQTESSSVALAVDIWSLGCTIIEMMNGKPPWSEYEGAAALFKVLKETPPIPETLSAEGKDFLQCCFRRNPADRATASQLLDHPFISCSYHPIKDIRLTDNLQLLRERSIHKKDQLPESFNAKIKKEKRGNNEANKRSHIQTPRLAVGPLPSPRSTLDPLPNLSPPSSRK